MKQLKWFLIILSATLHSVPFVVPDYTYWFSFVFLIPIFVLLLKRQRLTFLNGLVWGLVSFAINYYGLFFFFIEQGTSHFKWLAWLLLWFYVAVYAGLWFWVSTQLITLITHSKHRSLITVITFAGTAVGYFYWLVTSLLWFFGAQEGTLFSFPLIPMVAQPQWLVLLSIINKYLLLLLLFCAQGLISLFVITHYKRYLVLSLFLITPFIAGWFKPIDKLGVPTWFTQIGFLIPNHLDNAYDCAQELMEQVQLLSEDKNIKIIIGPESTFPFALNKYKQCFAMLAENGIEARHLLIGAHRKNIHKLFNSLYWIKQRRIILAYDKNHLTLFAENLSSIWKKIGITKNLFLHKKDSFCAGCKIARPIDLELVTFYPMICSELFFADQPPAINSNTVILLIANDYWFSAPYLKRLMALVAQFKAIEWQQPILYVSHENRLLFSGQLRYTGKNDNC